MGLSADGASNRPSSGEPVEELRAKAKVLALQPNQAARRAAIGILEQVLDREPDASPDRDLLVQFYDQVGQWTKARNEMFTLLAAEADNPGYIAGAIRLSCGMARTTTRGPGWSSWKNCARTLTRPSS